MNNQMTEAGNLKARTKKNTCRILYWGIAWVLSTALVAFGPESIWDSNTALTILAIFINLGIGFGMIMANKRHLKGLDDLQQKIQLEGMALALGVGLVLGLSYEMLEDAHIISFEPEISHLIMFMSLAYIIGVKLGNRRYR